MQDIVVETQMKRDQARKAEPERASISHSVAGIFREDESEKKKFFWKEVAANSKERVKKSDEARELTAKVAEKLARLERAGKKRREFLAMTEAYEKEKMRLLEIQQALGQ